MSNLVLRGERKNNLIAWTTKELISFLQDGQDYFSVYFLEQPDESTNFCYELNLIIFCDLRRLSSAKSGVYTSTGINQTTQRVPIPTLNYRGGESEK